MTKKIYRKKERAPSHAGEILKSGFIEQYELSVVVVSELLGISREHLSRIINGHAPVTSDIAAKLEILTKTPASQWLAIQANYDSYIMQQDANFKKYKQAVEVWVAGALSMTPEERRSNKKTVALVTKVSELAKCAKKSMKAA